MNRRNVLSLAALSLLSACGGGGGGSSEPLTVNTPAPAPSPTVAPALVTPRAPLVPVCKNAGKYHGENCESELVVFNGEILVIHFLRPFSSTTTLTARR